MIDREDIIRMAKEARMPYFYGTWEIANLDGLERFAELVAAYEREECAKVCEEVDDRLTEFHALDCAVAIRARGDK
jgi:hypothetical protein